MDDVLIHFEPHPLVFNGWWQTVIGSRCGGDSIPIERHCHKLRLGLNCSLVIFELKGTNGNKPLILMAHGMGGCSESGYMKRIAAKLWENGYGVFLMNHRGSGLGMGMSDKLWNGGSSDDLEAVIEFIRKIRPRQQILLIGFSLSGNILLKYLGENRVIPLYVSKALAVNPPVDLRTASSLLSNAKGNQIFNRYYMSLLRDQAEALVECFPDAFHPPLDAKTIWDFDVAYTAPAAKFRDVEDYYYQCSSSRFLDNIKIPSTILCAKDDPFIPYQTLESACKNNYIKVVSPDRGGHMGYISKRNSAFSDRRWMDYFILNWVREKA